MQPNTLSLSRYGGRPNQTSAWVFISNTVEGHLFIRYVVVESASAQNTFFNPALVNMHLTLSKMVRLNLSAKPFCLGSSYRSYVPCNARPNIIAIKSLITKFKAIIGSQPLDLSSNLIFNQSLPTFEVLKSFSLRLQDEYP
jgi:hypothetical protein